MAKIFRIKNRGLRWVAGSVVLLCLVAMVSFLSYYLLFGVGYGLNAFNSVWFSEILCYHKENPTVGEFVIGGFFFLGFVAILCWAIWLFLRTARQIGNKLFNSIGDSKKQGGS